MRRLIQEYKKKRPSIRRRLREFDIFETAREEDIFSELCFCLFTPGSKALQCDKAVKILKAKGLLLKGDREDISQRIRGLVRFHNNKSLYLTQARRCFINGRSIFIKDRISGSDIIGARRWLVDNIKGLGYKEASHFLRNIGLGKGIAILDVHILKNLKKYGVIDKIPVSISKKSYLAIEEKMRRFSKRIDIPMEDMDLLFWSQQTGYIFK